MQVCALQRQSLLQKHIGKRCVHFLLVLSAAYFIIISVNAGRFKAAAAVSRAKTAEAARDRLEDDLIMAEQEASSCSRTPLNDKPVDDSPVRDALQL